MKIYMLRTNIDDYKGLFPIDDNFWEDAALRFDGNNSLLCSWRNLELECSAEDSKLENADFPYFSLAAIPVFSEKAALVLNELIKSCGEFLSASYGGNIYYLFNVTRVLDDVVSKGHSEFQRLPTGRIVKVKKIAFIDSIEYPPIFKWSEMPMGNVFVNQTFKDLVDLYSLKGFSFISCDIVDQRNQ